MHKNRIRILLDTLRIFVHIPTPRTAGDPDPQSKDNFASGSIVKESTVSQIRESAKDCSVFRTELWHRQGEFVKLESRSDYTYMRRYANRNCGFSVYIPI